MSKRLTFMMVLPWQHGKSSTKSMARIGHGCCGLGGGKTSWAAHKQYLKRWTFWCHRACRIWTHAIMPVMPCQSCLITVYKDIHSTTMQHIHSVFFTCQYQAFILVYCFLVMIPDYCLYPIFELALNSRFFLLVDNLQYWSVLSHYPAFTADLYHTVIKGLASGDCMN